MYDFIPQIMREAAKIMLSAHDIDSVISAKPGDVNFVTAYDVAVQEFLCTKLREKLPEAVIIGEEENEHHTELLKSSLALIIDPIDGTTNFIHNYRTSAISIGVCDHGTMIYGAVYDPYSDRLYHAERGNGAFVTTKNGDMQLHVSNRSLKDALTGYGTAPYDKQELSDKTFRTAYKLFRHTRDLRRSGSAALDLCNVACGSFDLFFEYKLSPWDFAAGSLIIEEAGGVITKMDGTPMTFEKPCPTVAGNPVAHREALSGGFFEID